MPCARPRTSQLSSGPPPTGRTFTHSSLDPSSRVWASLGRIAWLVLTRTWPGEASAFLDRADDLKGKPDIFKVDWVSNTMKAKMGDSFFNKFLEAMPVKLSGDELLQGGLLQRAFEISRMALDGYPDQATIPAARTRAR